MGYKPQITNLGCIRGDTYVQQVTIQQDGSPVDLTGATAYFTIKKAISQTDAEANFQQTITSHTNPTSGITTIAISQSDWSDEGTDLEGGKYYYDLQVVFSDGTKYTYLIGTFEITADVTKT